MRQLALMIVLLKVALLFIGCAQTSAAMYDLYQDEQARF